MTEAEPTEPVSYSINSFLYEKSTCLCLLRKIFYVSSLLCCALQYDIDGDGVLDILLVSTSGEIIFYRHDGLRFSQFSYQVGVLVLAVLLGRV